MVTQTLTVTPAIERYVNTAAIAGCPADQVGRFVSGGYVALPWALPVHAAARELDNTPPDDPTPIILCGGARGPGKSHLWLAQAGLDDCQRYPGLKVLFLRKIQKAAGESFDDLVQRIFHSVPHTWAPSRGRLDFENGSRIYIGGFRHPSEIEKYIGIQYDLVIPEEWTQILYASIEKLMGSVRSSRPGYVPRVYASTNPGGVSHLETKRDFVDPYFRGVKGRGLYFPATYRDNPFLNRQYVTWLEDLKGPLGKAWRDGDWSAFEGMAFPTWDVERLVLKQPVMPDEVPAHWKKWVAVDDGTTAPWAAYLEAQDPKTLRLYILDERYGAGLSDTEQAQMIVQMWKDWRLPGSPRGFGDPAMWATKKLGEYVSDTAEEYRKNGVYLEKGDNNRLSGKRRTDRLLADYPDGEPGVKISPVCVNLIDTMPALPTDPNRPEDVDTDAEDHAYDAAFRYGTTRVQIPHIDLEGDYQRKQQKKKQQAPLMSVFGS